MHNLANFIKSHKQRLSKNYEIYNSVMDNTISANISRIYYGAMLAMALSAGHIIAFLFFVHPNTSVEFTWRVGIVACHTGLFLLFLVMFLITIKKSKWKRPGRFMRFLPFVFCVLLMLAGVLVAVVDQLITTSLAPFIIVALIIAVFILNRPSHSILIFIVGFIAIFNLLPFSIKNPMILASVRANAGTVLLLGLAVSNTMWRLNVAKILQQSIIQKQKEDLEEKNRELKYLAYYDFLTGLYNRRHFETLFYKKLETLKRVGGKACLAIMDIDFFKKINDDYGHIVGDEVLINVSTILMRNLRRDDMIARWGGEEFIFMFMDTNVDQANMITEKLRRIFNEEIIEAMDFDIKLTISFGISEINMDLEIKKAFDDCYHKADTALYFAKQNGRNRVEIYNASTTM